jgi:hypothetical protein
MKFSEMADQELFSKALDKAGYIDLEPTEQNVRDCFIDYACSGAWGNVEVDFETNDISTDNGEEITSREMAIGLIKHCC